MQLRALLLIGSVMPMMLLAACGGSGGGSVASTPPPPPAPVPPPPPPPPTNVFNTAEYGRSGAAVQAQALAAYDAGASGAGVVAAVIDSGVDRTSAEFSGRISSFPKTWKPAMKSTGTGGAVHLQ